MKGTAVRLLLPLQEDPTTPSRLPAWPQKRSLNGGQSLIFPQGREPIFHIQPVPPELAEGEIYWDSFLSNIAQELEPQTPLLVVLDLAGLTLSRGVLEKLFEAFILNERLHGCLILVNCSRHVASRFDTVSTALQLENEKLIIPFFDPNLALYLVGVTLRSENLLLSLFEHPHIEVKVPELLHLVEKNANLFTQSIDSRFRFSFNLSHIEEIARKRLGERLRTSLEERKALNEGRFLLPLSQHTVPLYVEPHQIFADPQIATELCRHLALLLRRRYRDSLSGPEKKAFRVLTATRIGRDISMWMPEGFPRQVFVFFDSHLVRPDKPRLQKLLQDGRVVIVVDIVSSGTVVSQLLSICHDARASVLSVISLIDFSPENANPHLRQEFQIASGMPVEHLTFWRSPRTLLEPRPDDIQVDPVTLSISPPPLLEEAHSKRASQLERDHALRLLVDAQLLHYGHFDLFGRHYEFATNLPRLFSVPSYLHDEVCRACEEAIFDSSSGLPAAIVLYPDLSHCHLLLAALAQRPRLRQAQREDSIKVVEARRASRAFGRRYWLTNQEVLTLHNWAASKYPSGFSVLLLDDAASSGETLLALLELARSLKPGSVHAFVIQNRMPQVRTGHHEAIQRFEWASSQFSSFLSLNLPTFTRDNCPLCRERSELASELRTARTDWFREALQRRIDRLEVLSTLNAHDLPEGPLTQRLEGFRGFPWDNRTVLAVNDNQAIVWAMSARLAIYRGVGLMDVFESISGVSDEVWRVTLLEIARRNDLQQAQHVEDRLIESLRRVLQDSSRDRRSIALEVLRFFRPEKLLPQLERLLETTLEGLITDEILAELYILLRRVLSYRHLQATQVADQEASISVKLDELSSRESPGTARYAQLERLRAEWSNFSLRTDDLVSIARELDVLLKISLRDEHRILTNGLRSYMPEAAKPWDTKFQEYLHKALKAIRLSARLPPLLEKASCTLTEGLTEVVDEGIRAFDDLRTTLINWRQPGSHVVYRNLTDRLEIIEGTLDAVANEIRRMMIDPLDALRTGIEEFRKSHFNIHCSVVITTENLPPDTKIFLDAVLYQEIVQNVTSNLRHAVDTRLNRVEATLSLSLRDTLGDSWVELRIHCRTRSDKKLDRSGAKSTSYFERLARFFGTDHYIKPESWDSLENPWEETWTFRRLGS